MSRTALQAVKKFALDDAILAPSVSGIHLVAPPATALPYAILARVSHEHITTASRAFEPGVSREVIQIGLYATSDDDVVGLLSLWRARFLAPGTRLPIDGDRFRSITFLNETGPDREGDPGTGLSGVDVFGCTFDVLVISQAEV